MLLRRVQGLKARHWPQPSHLADQLLLVAWAGLIWVAVAELRSCAYTAGIGGGAVSGGARLEPGDSNSTTGDLLAGAGSSSLTWDQLNKLLQLPAGLHGRLKKGGMPADWPKLLAHMTNKNAQLHGVPEFMSQAVFRWFAAAYAYTKSERRATGVSLESPVPPCHFYVDHKYRILYVRSTKTASTSITNTLGVKENPKTCKLSNTACWALCKGKPVCLAYLWDANELKKVWPDYTVFSFVRNPWSRAVSSWLHINENGLKRTCHDSFAKFAEVPSGYGAKCLASPECCLRRFGWILEHIEPQSRCLFDNGGQPAVDFLGRVEHLDEDMKAVLELINSRRPMGVPALAVSSMPHLMPMAAASSTSKEEKKRRQYVDLYRNSSALEDIYSYFRQDFEKLQFPLQQSRAFMEGGAAEPATAEKGDGGPSAGS